MALVRIQRSVAALPYLVSFAFLSILASCGGSDTPPDDSDTIKQENLTPVEFVEAWNTVLVSGDTAQLKTYYAPELNYYGQLLPISAVVRDKARFLSSNPDFRQVITPPVDISDAEGSGVRISFGKAMQYGDTEQEVKGYLLLRPLPEGGYEIVTESDKVTDTNIRRQYGYDIPEPSSECERDLRALFEAAPKVRTLIAQLRTEGKQPSFLHVDTPADGSISYYIGVDAPDLFEPRLFLKVNLTTGQLYEYRPDTNETRAIEYDRNIGARLKASCSDMLAGVGGE